jgi:hypothetical protein
LYWFAFLPCPSPNERKKKEKKEKKKKRESSYYGIVGKINNRLKQRNVL